MTAKIMSAWETQILMKEIFSCLHYRILLRSAKAKSAESSPEHVLFSLFKCYRMLVAASNLFFEIGWRSPSLYLRLLSLYGISVKIS